MHMWINRVAQPKICSKLIQAYKTLNEQFNNFESQNSRNFKPTHIN